MSREDIPPEGAQFHPTAPSRATIKTNDSSTLDRTLSSSSQHQPHQGSVHLHHCYWHPSYATLVDPNPTYTCSQQQFNTSNMALSALISRASEGELRTFSFTNQPTSTSFLPSIRHVWFTRVLHQDATESHRAHLPRPPPFADPISAAAVLPTTVVSEGVPMTIPTTTIPSCIIHFLQSPSFFEFLCPFRVNSEFFFQFWCLFRVTLSIGASIMHRTKYLLHSYERECGNCENVQSATEEVSVVSYHVCPIYLNLGAIETYFSRFSVWNYNLHVNVVAKIL
jgi:hypothetical protein